MIIEGILIGVLGNAAYELIKGIGSQVFDESDDDLYKRLYNAIDKACELFFKKYSNTYGSPDNSFLARQENIEIIVKSIYYNNQDNLYDKISPKGFDGAPDASLEAIKFYISTLQKIMLEDFRLDKILVEKKHIRESDEKNKQIIGLLEQLVNQNHKVEQQSSKHKENYTMLDMLGNKLPFNEGKRYDYTFPDGTILTFMIKKDTIFADFTAIDGMVSYYELDFSGNVKESKFPFELSEYKVYIPQEHIISKRTIHLDNGHYQELYILKWNRQALIEYNSIGRIQGFEVKGGWHVDHRDKTVTIVDL